MIFLKTNQLEINSSKKKQYYYFFWCFTFTFFSLPSLSTTEYTLAGFDFSSEQPSDCSDYDNHCYSIEELLHEAIKSGLDSRQAIQILFNARQNIRTKMGLILPQINITNLAGMALDSTVSLNTILPFVGFLFPNRWYDWKSSRFLRDAQIESVATVFANKAQTVLDLYYNIEMQLWSIRFLEFYTFEIEKLVAFLNTQIVDGHRRATDEDIGILENIRGKLIYQRSFVDAVSATLSQLATAVGFPPNVDWASMKLEPHQMTFLENETFKEYMEFWPDAIKRSTEVKNMKSLISSAKRDKRSVYFDFIDPSSGHDLGFGYGSRIKIARANIEILKIQLGKTKRQVSNAIHNALNNYNDAVRSFPGIISALECMKDIKKAVEDNINNTKTPLDITSMARYFEFAANQGFLYINGYFAFKTAEADLNRLTWRGEYYDIVSFYRHHGIKQFLKDVRKQHSHHKAFAAKVGNIYHKIRPHNH